MTRSDIAKQAILGYAREHFFKAGFAHVTTDEIAAELGISKKTLYKHFRSKERLVEIVVGQFAAESLAAVDAVLYDRKMDFLAKIKKVMAVIHAVYANISVPFARDLKRSMPVFYEEMIERRRKAIWEQFGAMVREGMRKGIFRKDFDAEIVLLSYLHTMNGIIVPERLARMNLSAAEMFEMIYRLIHEGILTEKARKKYHG